MRIFATLFAGLLGLAFGSFLNVCLTRWPAGESVVKPRSHCRSCGRTLAWRENVPVLSWLALRGRCRTCSAWIGSRYATVELAVGAVWAAIAWQAASFAAGIVSLTPRDLLEAAVALAGKMLLVWLLVALAALDVEHLWLPDALTLPGIALGIGVALVHREPLVTIGRFNPSLLLELMNLAFAILIAAGLILLIRWIYWLIRRREGIGLGDAKLMAMLAAWLGLPGALLSFALGVVLGALAGLILVLLPRTRQEAPRGLIKLPLGTFLCIGGIVTTLWGSQLLSAYLRWAGFNEISMLW